MSDCVIFSYIIILFLYNNYDKCFVKWFCNRLCSVWYLWHHSCYRLVLISVVKTYYFVLPYDKNLLNRIYSVTQFTSFTFKEEKVCSNMVFVSRSNNIIYPYNESCSSVFQNVLWVFTAVTGVELLFKVYCSRSTVHRTRYYIFLMRTLKWIRDDQLWKAIHLYYTGWPSCS